MTLIRAHEVKGVRQATAAGDGKMGLLGFERRRPDSNGDKMIWLAVPVSQLPMVAAASIKAIPQPESSTGKHPAVFEAKSVKLSLGPFGEMILTLGFHEGAALALKLTERQSKMLARGIREALGQAARLSTPDRRPS